MRVRLMESRFDPGAETNRFLEKTAGAGAAVTFTGLVRATPKVPIISMTLEHYPALAQTQLETLANEAKTRFDLIDVDIIHRFGKMVPGEPIMQVMTLASHRADAFAAAQFLMDSLKTNAPFWKKETGPDGDAWVAAKDEDDEASKRWQK